jgi:poly(A) polymerase
VDGRILRDNVWGNIEQDAVRRDFTINAMFMDPLSGDIRDFVGGYEDLRARRLKLIGDPQTRYREDPVRLLRAARFMAKLGLEPVPATADPISVMAPLLEQIPPARLFEEVCKLFLTGHGRRTLDALQDYGLMPVLFPVLSAGNEAGTIQSSELLERALVNTDERISEDMSVTPAFLFAALLWPAVEQRVQQLMDIGATDYQALERAGDEVIAGQVFRTAIPKRFSAVTRQIWLNQARLARTKGKRAMRVLHQPRFRAAYDFLALRAQVDPELEELREFWESAQQGVTPARDEPERPAPNPRRRRRGGRGRRRKTPPADS